MKIKEIEDAKEAYKKIKEDIIFIKIMLVFIAMLLGVILTLI